MNKHLRFLFLVLSWGLIPFFSVFAQNSFRIYPYLQFNNQKIQIRWFSGDNLPCSLIIKDNLGVQVISEAISGVEISEFYYTQAEKSQSISGLGSANWIGSENYFKYEKNLYLQYDRNYTYTINLGGEIFSSSFKTAPSSSDWQSIRFIALSDSETEPRGRVTNRAWYPGKPLFRLYPVPSSWKAAFGTTTEEVSNCQTICLPSKKDSPKTLKF